MTTHRQFVAVKFRPNDKRTYTYHNDGPPVRVGDTVKVPSVRADEGWSPLPVVSVSDDVPPFPTKAILGVVDGAARDAAILSKEAPKVADLFGGDA